MHERMTTTVYNDYEDLFLENRLECEIIAWKHITNPAINLHAIKPRTSVNVLVISVRIPGEFTGETDRIRSGGAIGAGAPGIDKLKVGMFLVVLLLVNLFGGPKAHLQYLNQSFAP